MIRLRRGGPKPNGRGYGSRVLTRQRHYSRCAGIRQSLESKNNNSFCWRLSTENRKNTTKRDALQKRPVSMSQKAFVGAIIDRPQILQSKICRRKAKVSAPSLRGLSALADWGSIPRRKDTPSDPAMPGHLPHMGYVKMARRGDPCGRPLGAAGYAGRP